MFTIVGVVSPTRPLKNATLRQLVTFHTLARLGSVSRTAEELHLTQPAVSLQLGILEESAGTPLLARGARGVRLTEAGVVLAGYASRLLQVWNEASEAMAAQCGQVAGTLRVGVVTTAEYLMPQLVLEFTRQHRQVGVKLSVGNRADIAAQLAQQEIDLAIMGRPPAELRVDAAPFAHHPMAFVAAPDHPLLDKPGATLADVAEVPLLLRERGSGTRLAVEQLFKTAGIEMRLGAETSSNEAIKQLCAAGYGVAFISLHACVLELQAGLLAQLPLPGHPIVRAWYAISLADRPLPAAAAAFGVFLREQGQARLDAKLAADRERMAPMTRRRSPRAARP
ncbi:regulatory protein CysB [Piscinibacter sakaiensis]|uniref:Regulatory protein CysB n=1 Tax=Piscinibacter sakaiensis TaxID=1547922 RepID=A0A0K8P257_PISS1|nr:regulatory protein CysB [Piscinibacter sakaiensis]